MLRLQTRPLPKAKNSRADVLGAPGRRITCRFGVRVSIGVLAVGALGLGVYQLGLSEVTYPDSALLTRRDDVPVPPQPPSGHPSGRSQMIPIVRTATRSPIRSWSDRFDASTDLRAFVAEARGDPATGGDFYAIGALAECRLQVLGDTPIELITGTEFRTHAALQRRAQLLERSLRRCAAFLPEELRDDAIRAIDAEGQARGDPLIAAYNTWLDALDTGDYEHLIPALKAALERSDPLLLQSIADSGSVYWTSFAQSGASVDEASMARALEAWRVMPCEIGRNCAVFDEQARSACLNFGRCEPDQVSAVLATDKMRSEVDKRLLAADVDLLLQAVQRRDAALLLGAPIR